MINSFSIAAILSIAAIFSIAAIPAENIRGVKKNISQLTDNQIDVPSSGTAVNIATYNIGMLGDYRNQLVRSAKWSQKQGQRIPYDLYEAYKIVLAEGGDLQNRKQIHAMTPLESKTLKPLREQAITQIFHKTKLKNQDILLLQEVKTKDDINLIKSVLKDQGFKIRYTPGGTTDTLVAWKKHRFEYIKNQAGDFTKTQSVMLFDKVTQKTIRVASAHISGFNLKRPEIDKCQTGDQLVRNYTHFLQDKQRADIDVIGGDFNCEFYPRYIRETCGERAYHAAINRFKILTVGNDFKFKVNTDPTAYNPDLKGKRAALDHFFYRHNSSTPVNAVLNLSDIPLCDIINNPSDHAPVYLKIQFL